MTLIMVYECTANLSRYSLWKGFLSGSVRCDLKVILPSLDLFCLLSVGFGLRIQSAGQVFRYVNKSLAERHCHEMRKRRLKGYHM